MEDQKTSISQEATFHVVLRDKHRSEIEIYLRSGAVDVWHEFIHAAQHSRIDLSAYPYPLITSRFVMAT
jgi:hypothetical protein